MPLVGPKRQETNWHLLSLTPNTSRLRHRCPVVQSAENVRRPKKPGSQLCHNCQMLGQFVVRSSQLIKLILAYTCSLFLLLFSVFENFVVKRFPDVSRSIPADEYDTSSL